VICGPFIKVCIEGKRAILFFSECDRNHLEADLTGSSHDVALVTPCASDLTLARSFSMTINCSFTADTKPKDTCGSLVFVLENFSGFCFHSGTAKSANFAIALDRHERKFCRGCCVCPRCFRACPLFALRRACCRVSSAMVPLTPMLATHERSAIIGQETLVAYFHDVGPPKTSPPSTP